MLNIRKLRQNDKDIYVRMAKEFYASDAVLLHIGEENILNTFDELMRSDTYAECHIFEFDGDVAGYSLLAKTFSQEAGGRVVWIEELYVMPEYRSRGIGRAYFEYLFKNNPEVRRFRLEVEADNERAIKLYSYLGFTQLGYGQMIIDRAETEDQ